MAGTFSTVPPQLTQLYTIHGLRHGKNVVVTYCLLTNKRQNIYVEIRQQVEGLTNNINLQSVMTDFHQAMISALNHEYPMVSRSVCLFYFSKSIYRKVQELGLAQRYNNDEEFRYRNGYNFCICTSSGYYPIFPCFGCLFWRRGTTSLGLL